MPIKDIRLIVLAFAAFLCLAGGSWFLAAGLLAPASETAGDLADAAMSENTQPQTQSSQQPAAQQTAASPPVSLPPPAIISPEAMAERKSLEEQIAAIPEISRFFDRLRLTAPSDYDAALLSLAQRKSATMEQSPDVWLSEAVKTLRQSRGILAAKADGPTLSKVFERQLTVLKALGQRSPAVCVEFLYGGASADFYKFSADNRTKTVDLAVAGLDAIVDGRQKNIARSAPTEADFQVFENALKQRGLGAPEISALLDGVAPNPPLADDRMCQAGQIYIDTLIKLPDPARARIQSLAIELLARS